MENQRRHFELTKKNVLIVIVIFLVCFGLPIWLFLNL